MSKKFLVFMLLTVCAVLPVQAKTLQDSLGREVTVPEKINHVICSGPGCLRLLTYLQAIDLVAAVDDIEAKRRKFDARPYALANQQLKKLPIFGEFRGHDNPERILALEKQPDVIFKTYATMGHDPVELQEKTGIPVIVLNYGNLTSMRLQLYESLRIMGAVLDKSQRAGEVIDFFDTVINDLQSRTQAIDPGTGPTVYLGGVAFKGPHGFQSTEPLYPPFQFVTVRNLAYDGAKTAKELSNSNVAKEQIVAWDPDILFLDLATLQLGDEAGGLYELLHDPAYRALTAVVESKVYGVLPYNWYSKNYGSILANGYFVGKLLYPEKFQDVQPHRKADEIYTFLVGKPVFDQMDAMFGNLAYRQIKMD